MIHKDSSFIESWGLKIVGIINIVSPKRLRTNVCFVFWNEVKVEAQGAKNLLNNLNKLRLR